MADDIPDPLAGWTPAPFTAQPSVPDPLSAPPSKSILQTSYHTLPSDTRQGQEKDDPPSRILAAVKEAWDTGNPITPGWQAKMNAAPGPFGWVNRNIVNPALGTVGGGVGAAGAAVGSTLGELADQVAPGARRDVSALLQSVPPGVAIEGQMLRTTAPADVGPLRAALTPEPPVRTGVPQPASLYVNSPLPTSDPALLRRLPTTDPVTASAIDLLKNKGSPTAIPAAPKPFDLTPGPQPAPSGGLLNMGQPAPSPQGGLLGPTGNVVPMTQADMQAVAKGHFSPADQAIAAGLRLTPAEADAIRNPLMKKMPDDPQTMAIDANKPVVEAATTYAKPFMGQDMGVDTAMKIDRDLGSRIRATKDPEDRTDLLQARQGVRDAMEQSSVFQQQPQARQAWNQSIKQGQIEDLTHDVGLRDDDKQPAYLKSRIQSMLQNSDTVLRNWSPDEVAELRKQYDSGNISSLKQFGINMVKPLATVTGGAVGSWLSPGFGTYVGSRLGEQGGDLAAAALRRRAGTIDLTPVSQRLTTNMPPPPAGWSPSP